ncbi:proteophosphoglycan ppg4 [Rhodotorula toruloides]|uniref:Proteophosphoglycan ppg4 n=1 Tax=Rhodotorula toruloides TaxID=5286 RepID=A0A511KD41_RHOTO|nr:proteophosphoglycan ppg4 [Rhodotorula toruloides]
MASHKSRSTGRASLCSLNLRLDNLTQDLNEVAGAIQSASSAEAGRSLGVTRKTIKRKPERPEMNAVHGRPVNKRAPTPPLVPPSKRRRMTLAPIAPSRPSSRDDTLDDGAPDKPAAPSVLLDRRRSPESGRMRTIAREANDFPATVQTSQGLLQLPSFMRSQEAPTRRLEEKSPTPPWLAEYVQPKAEFGSLISQPSSARYRPLSSISSRLNMPYEYTAPAAPLRKLPSIDQVPVSYSDACWPASRRTPLPFSTSGRRQSLSPMSASFSPVHPSDIYRAQLAKPMHLFDAGHYGRKPDGDWNLPLSPSYPSLPHEMRTNAGPFQTTSARQAMLLSPPRQPVRTSLNNDSHRFDHGGLSRHSTFDCPQSYTPRPQAPFSHGFVTPPRLTNTFGWREPVCPPSPAVAFAPTSDDSLPQADPSEVPRFWRKAPLMALPSQPPPPQPGRARYAALLEREAASQVVHRALAGSETFVESQHQRESHSNLIHSTSSLPPSPQHSHGALSPTQQPERLQVDKPVTTHVVKQVEQVIAPATLGVDPQLLSGFAPSHVEDSQATDCSYEESQQSIRAEPVFPQATPTWDFLGSAADLRLALLSGEDAKKDVDANEQDGEGGFAIYQDSLGEDPIEEA